MAFIKQFKDVAPATVEYLQNNIAKKFGNLETHDVTKALSNGVSGEYGEFRTADPQTIFKWLYKFSEQREKSANYVESPLAPLDMSVNENWDWNKEANKCYTAWINGTEAKNFHEGVYMRMQCDGMISINARSNKPYYHCIEDVFKAERQNGKKFIYYTGVEDLN